MRSIFLASILGVGALFSGVSEGRADLKSFSCNAGCSRGLAQSYFNTTSQAAQAIEQGINVCLKKCQSNVSNFSRTLANYVKGNSDDKVNFLCTNVDKTNSAFQTLIDACKNKGF